MPFQYLLAELARIDLLIRREVLRWQLAGQDPDDDFRGLRMTEADAVALAARPFGVSWGQTAALEPQDEESFAAAMAEAERNTHRTAETARQQGEPSRLAQLAIAFELERFDLDVLLIALAPALDNRYERLYSYLQDDVTRKRPSVNLALDLLAAPGPERLLRLAHFNDSAPLFRHQLLERAAEPNSNRTSLLNQILLLDETVAAWLLGDYQPHADLGSHACLIQPQPDATDTLLSAPAWPDLERAIVVQREAGRSALPNWPIVVFYGADQAGQLASARRFAAHLERPLLQVDLAGLIGPELTPLRAIILALRDARLIGAIPFFTGWDACLADGAPAPDVLAALCQYPDLVIVAGRGGWQARSERDRALLWLEFSIPDYQHRRALWLHFLREAAVDAASIESLANQFFLTAEQIRDSVASARDLAAQRGEPLQAADLFLAARAHSNPNLSGLARKITPRYQWSDIILPDDQITILREIVSTVRGRPKVLEEWRVGEKLAASAGITILFAGSPGTGKTMAAEVIAAELGLDLYKIELSTIVSKYIGETEKNLERIFNEAQSSNAILFFDEADAIFGKRSEVKDAHDRYANIEVSYLLQRMESYDGVTILATNLRANLDEAFTRRLQFAVDFPFPDAAYRRQIWETLFPPGVPRAPDVDLAVLAQRFKLAGGNIRNIIVGAAYLAAADGGAVTMTHLLHGARRELQKMGRLIKEKDMTS